MTGPIRADLALEADTLRLTVHGTWTIRTADAAQAALPPRRETGFGRLVVATGAVDALDTA
ncbi:MAG: hypothetical protein ACK51F_09155, partial [Rhodospirillales bacterium]